MTVHLTSSLAIIFILGLFKSLSPIIVELSKSLSFLFVEYFNMPINSSVPYISFSFPSKSHRHIVPSFIQKRPSKSVIIWSFLNSKLVVNSSKLSFVSSSKKLNNSNLKGFLCIKFVSIS